MHKTIAVTQYITVIPVYLSSFMHKTVLNSSKLYKYCISHFMIFQHKVVHAMIIFTTYTLFFPDNKIAFAYEELSSMVLSHHKLLYEEQMACFCYQLKA